MVKEVSKRALVLITLIFLVAVSMSILAGCGEPPECKEDFECSDGLNCTRDTCQDKTCVYKPMPNCNYANGRCEENLGENQCTAPKDCGVCKDVGKSNYTVLGLSCDINNECTLGFDKSSIETKIVTDKYEPREGPSMEFTISYDVPFDLDTSQFGIDSKLIKKPAGLTEMTIKRIRIVDEEYNRATRSTDTTVYADKQVNLKIWEENKKATALIPIEKEMAKIEHQFTPIIIIDYSYIGPDRRGTLVETDLVQRKELSEEVLFVDPEAGVVCPSSCEDGNVCTEDKCPPGRGYCIHVLKSGPCCGNNICDEGNSKVAAETMCSCPEDCGLCESLKGAYTEYLCSGDQCVSRITNPDEVKSTTKVHDTTIAGYHSILKYTYDAPFDLRTSRVKIEVETVSIDASYKDLKFTKIQVLSGNELMGEQTSSVLMPLANAEPIQITVPVDFDIHETEESKPLQMKIYFEYETLNRDSEWVKAYFTYSYAVGTLDFIRTDVD